MNGIPSSTIVKKWTLEPLPVLFKFRGFTMWSRIGVHVELRVARKILERINEYSEAAIDAVYFFRIIDVAEVVEHEWSDTALTSGCYDSDIFVKELSFDLVAPVSVVVKEDILALLFVLTVWLPLKVPSSPT
jgi:hypothetical protein